jgi:uncharacterized cupredoxin-like copper-binding protein
MRSITRVGFVACLALAALIALGAAGCGGGGNNNSSSTSNTTTTTPASTTPAAGASGGKTLNLEADPNGALSFNKTSLAAKAGTVKIVMKNPSSLQHDVAITGNGVDEKGATVSNGGTSTVSADLKPGKYTFYCSVDSHRQAGMEGTLTVK